MAKIIGEASIRLRAEAKGLAVEIRRIVTAAIKEGTTGISGESPTKTLAKGAEQDADRVSRSVRKTLGDVVSFAAAAGVSMAGATLKAVKFATIIGSVASSASGAISIIGGLGEAISGLGAAAAGVAVAGLTAMLALSTTLKIATSGMGEAFKAVAQGDAQALQEALKGMAPAARSFVTETAKLKPLFEDIRLATQAALFKNLGTEVLATGRALGSTFKGLFVGVATQVNEAAKQVLGFLREARTVADLRQISDNVTGGFREVSQAGRSIVQVIVDIVKSATELLPGLGQSIEELTKRFAAFIRLKSDSGELTQFFRDGIETAKQFGRILRDLGVGISNVFKAGSDSGGGFLNILEQAAAAFRNFTESIGGQLILRQIFDTIGRVSGAFGEMLGALKPLLPLVGRFAEILADSLVSILEELGPILLEVGKVLLDTLGEVLPILTPFIIELAKGLGEILKALIPLAIPLAKLLAALTPLIDPIVRLAQAVLPPLAKILEAIAPLVELLARVLGFLLNAVAFLLTPLGWLADGIAAVANAIPGALGNVGKLKQAFMDILGIPTGDFKNKGRDIIDAIADGVDLGKKDFLSGVRNTLIEAVTIFSGQKPTWEREGMSLMESVNAGFQTQEFLLRDKIQSILNGVLAIFGGKVDAFEFEGANMGKAFSTGFTEEQRKVIDQVRNTIQQMLNVLTGKEPDFNREGAAISRQLGSGMAGDRTPNQVAADVAGSIGRIFGGVNLFTEGASIMASLRNGLAAGVQAVKNVLTSVTSLIPTWKGPESVDRKLLVPAGKAIMGGLIQSIESQIPALRSMLATVTNVVATGLTPPSSAGFTLGAGATGTPDFAGGATPFILQQTNNMLPGADVNQFAAEVWRRGAADLAAGNSALNVAQQSIQSGMAAPGSIVNLGA